MNNLEEYETVAWQEIMRGLEKKYGTRDEKKLLEVVVLNWLDKIFTGEEVIEMTNRTYARIQATLHLPDRTGD